MMNKIKEKIMGWFGWCEVEALRRALAAEHKAVKELDRFKKNEYKKCMELMREEREKKEQNARKAEMYRMELGRKCTEADSLRYEVEKLQADLFSTEQFYRKQGVSLEAVKKVKRVKKGGRRYETK